MEALNFLNFTFELKNCEIIPISVVFTLHVMPTLPHTIVLVMFYMYSQRYDIQWLLTVFLAMIARENGCHFEDDDFFWSDNFSLQKSSG